LEWRFFCKTKASAPRKVLEMNRLMIATVLASIAAGAAALQNGGREIVTQGEILAVSTEEEPSP
jgi:hypothetical protein